MRGSSAAGTVGICFMLLCSLLSAPTGSRSSSSRCVSFIVSPSCIMHRVCPPGHLDPSAALEYLAKHHLIHGGGQHPSNTGVAAGGAAAAGGGGGGGGGQPGVVALVAENEPIAESETAPLQWHATAEAAARR